MADWFICPYRKIAGQPMRYCAMDDFTPDIHAVGGDWSETEILGNRALVKVRATAEVINAIAATPGFRRLPKSRLNDPLSDLSAGVKQELRDELLDMGYSLAEVRARFGDNLSGYTLGDVLRFAASRRLKPRYNQQTDEIICDGAPQQCRSVDDVDRAIA